MNNLLSSYLNYKRVCECPDEIILCDVRAHEFEYEAAKYDLECECENIGLTLVKFLSLMNSEVFANV